MARTNPTGQARSIKTVLMAGSAAACLATIANAQDADSNADEGVDEIIVTGFRASLQDALQQERASDNLVEVIEAVDIGKLPDQNLAEVLENVTGIQITRTAGIGTGVQIRGTDANRTEINGVTTVGSGSGRTGINFEDISASLIAAVEVTKAPEAATIEGSVGGTINLRTIRPLDLSDPLASFRVQAEDSSLSTDGWQPRLSGTVGNSWDTDAGAFGIVVSGSYTEQDVTAFRPRADRDNLVASDSGAASAQDFDFLPIQFLIQDYDNFEFETVNLSGSLEYAPNDNLRFYFDAIGVDQERRQESSRIQASGISLLAGVSVPDTFETVDFGTLNGQRIGTIQAATSGVLPVTQDSRDGNLRFSGDTGSRLTDSRIFRLGTEFETGPLTVVLEGAISTSDTETPSFNTTLNFINPNAPVNLDVLLENSRLNEIARQEYIAANGTEEGFEEPNYDSNENGTPFIYDLTDGALTFGVAFGTEFAPTPEQLLDPANVVLRDVNIGRNTAENSEDAFRADLSYDLTDMGMGDFLSSFQFGYRWNRTNSVRNEVTSRISLREIEDSPTGDLYSDILVPGPDNFDDGDGRDLFVENFLLIDAELIASDPDSVLATLNGAITEFGGSVPISEPTSSQTAFFDIEEDTKAFYGQLNFDTGVIRGNAGLRYVQTDIASNGNANLNGEIVGTRTKSDYDFVLPRINLAADIGDDIVLRAAYGQDIRRPNFDSLSTSVTFGTSPNTAVGIGNAGLVPEEVDSFDVSADWYFAPSAVVSVGYFRKERTGLFFDAQEDPATTTVTAANGTQLEVRDVTPPCEGGGIFNPIADQNVFAPLNANGEQTQGVGVCVPVERTINGEGETVQQGVEVTFQYDLSDFEGRLGWASGFGVQANYTHQEFSGGNSFRDPTSRARTIFSALGAEGVQQRVQLLNLSEDAYNITGYYEKYGLSARARYTWRSAFRSDDFGSTSSLPYGFPVVQDARGQLNASINYDVSENLNIGIEGINLTEAEVNQYAVNRDGPLAFQGLTDRRIVIGASYRF